MARRRGQNNSDNLEEMGAVIVLILSIWAWVKTGSLVLGIFVFIILMAAIVFLSLFFIKRANQKLYDSGIDEVDKMSGRDFERFLKELFKKRGFTVKETAVVGDYGADLILEKLGKRFVVQAKRWKQNVGIKAVQEAVGSIKHYNAHNGVVITNSYFTDNARELARSNSIELWDRDKLIDIIRETKKMDSGAVEKEELVKKKPAASLNSVSLRKKILCPRCGKPLVLRSGKRGRFWGCSAFPRCRFTKEYQVGSTVKPRSKDV